MSLKFMQVTWAKRLWLVGCHFFWFFGKVLEEEAS
jgi:hypothetical protein